MERIAFLGLGAMGARMAMRILEHGYPLTVWNRTPARCAPLIERGAATAPTPAAAAENADIVISMVRDDKASLDVWEAPRTGALEAMSDNAIAVECSTVSLSRVRALKRAASEKSLPFLDAPLAGSRPQAEAGQLIFFVGGEKRVLANCLALFNTMGSAAHHAGDEVGSGIILKLIVNALFAAQIAALAELTAVGEKSGVPQAAAASILEQTPVLSPAARGGLNAIVERVFAPQFPIDLVEKDLLYVEQLAKAAGAKTPLTNSVRDVFLNAKSKGFADDNITGVAQLY